MKYKKGKLIICDSRRWSGIDFLSGVIPLQSPNSGPSLSLARILEFSLPVLFPFLFLFLFYFYFYFFYFLFFLFFIFFIFYFFPFLLPFSLPISFIFFSNLLFHASRDARRASAFCL